MEEEIRVVKCKECRKEFAVLEGSFWGITYSDLCDSCLIQPERLNPETPKGDAIV